MTRNDDQREESLDDAKRKLDGTRGRPFDVDKVLAEDRARKERARIVEKQINEKLEKEYAEVRKRRHDLRAVEVSREEVLEEKRGRFEAEKQRFKKKQEDRQRDPKDKDTGKH